MVKLVNLRKLTEENVIFGTCGYCMSIGSLNKEWFVFEDEKGEILEIETGEWEILEIETGEWEYGDYEVKYEIANIIDFCQFILDKNILSLKILKKSFDDLYWEYMDR